MRPSGGVVRVAGEVVVRSSVKEHTGGTYVLKTEYEENPVWYLFVSSVSNCHPLLYVFARSVFSR